jgi:hypothetical protein
MAKKKTKLTEEEYQSEVLDIHRKLLGGVQLINIDFPTKLTGEDRLKFLKFCSMVANDEWFEKIFSALHWPHIEYAATKAPDYNVVTFNRATANGISLVKEFFQKYSRVYTNEYMKNDDEFDRTKPFEPLNL